MSLELPVNETASETPNDFSQLPASAFPAGVDPATPGVLARYQGDYSKTVGVVWTPDALVTAQVQDVSIQHEEQISKQGHLIVGRYMSGTNVLRATDAVELRTGAPT